MKKAVVIIKGSKFFSSPVRDSWAALLFMVLLKHLRTNWKNFVMSFRNCNCDIRISILMLKN